jgi:hypothetical protein
MGEGVRIRFYLQKNCSFFNLLNIIEHNQKLYYLFLVKKNPIMGYIKIFESKKVRSHWNEKEQTWYFSIIDIVEILSESERPRKYWSDLKKKLLQEGFEQLSEKIGQLKMESSDGKKYLTDVADVKTLLRII